MLSLDPAATRADILALDNDDLNSPGVTLSVFCVLDIFDAPLYFWSGLGAIEALGQTWLGAGDVMAIGDIPGGYFADAQNIELTLLGAEAAPSPLENILPRIEADTRQVEGRDAQVFWAIMDTTRAYSPLVGQPLQQFTGVIGNARTRLDGPEWGSVEISIDGPATKRRIPGGGLLTDASQKTRHPGDRGAEHIGKIVAGHEVRWTRS